MSYTKPTLIGSGDVLASLSGRIMAPAPRIDATTDRKAAASIQRMNAWLLDEARIEVRGDAWRLGLLRGLNPKAMSPSDQSMVNLILFGRDCY